MLSGQLEEIEKDKLLIKKILKSEILRTECSLTEFGKSAIPVVKSLIKWGSFNKKKITKVIDDDLERVIDLLNDKIRFKNLQRKKSIN